MSQQVEEIVSFIELTIDDSGSESVIGISKVKF